MRAKRSTAGDEALLDGRGPAWTGSSPHAVALMQAPVAMAVAVSPYIAISQSHGAVKSVSACALHNGATLNIRLAWDDPAKDDTIPDLDRFADAAAIMFPLLGEANPLTMGDEAQPVNVWLWRADRAEPFDVIARGFSTSQRRPASGSGLRARGRHVDGRWVVVYQRPLHPAGGEFAAFEAGATAKIAFAVWDGSNAERAGQKAISGAFIELPLDP